MKIGYSVEGSTDRAFIDGLRKLWCPHAELEEGRFRGSTIQSRRREYSRMLEAFALRGIDVVVFLADGDGENWQEVKQNELEYLPAERRQQVVFGVPDRNIECWICADPHWLAEQVGGDAQLFMNNNPKNAFHVALGIGRDKKEELISELVQRAPVHRWLVNRSFEDFYEQLRDCSQVHGCHIENLRDR